MSSYSEKTKSLVPDDFMQKWFKESAACSQRVVDELKESLNKGERVPICAATSQACIFCNPGPCGHRKGLKP